jgi:hypothetical protein
MDYKSNSKRIFSLLLNFFFCVFFLGEAHDKHVNTHLSLGVNPTHNSSRVSNNNLVINMMDTSKTEICVRTLPYAFSILYTVTTNSLRLCLKTTAQGEVVTPCKFEGGLEETKVQLSSLLA